MLVIARPLSGRPAAAMAYKSPMTELHGRVSLTDDGEDGGDEEEGGDDDE
jgi:hypothetical protein